LHTIHYLLASHTPFVTNSALVARTVSLTLERDYSAGAELEPLE
jgi:hypothetical protein